MSAVHATPTVLPSSIPALGANLPAKTGPLTIIYDPACTPALDVRARRGQAKAPTHLAILTPIRLLETALQPGWRLERLKARIPADAGAGGALDPAHLRQHLAGFAKAGDYLPADVRAVMRMHGRLTAVGGSQMDAAFRTEGAVDGEWRADDVGPAVTLFTRLGVRGWSIIARNILGPWCVASGITELRVSGTLADQPRTVQESAA